MNIFLLSLLLVNSLNAKIKTKILGIENYVKKNYTSIVRMKEGGVSQVYILEKKTDAGNLTIGASKSYLILSFYDKNSNCLLYTYPSPRD